MKKLKVKERKHIHKMIDILLDSDKEYNIIAIDSDTFKIFGKLPNAITVRSIWVKKW